MHVSAILSICVCNTVYRSRSSRGRLTLRRNLIINTNLIINVWKSAPLSVGDFHLEKFMQQSLNADFHKSDKI